MCHQVIILMGFFCVLVQVKEVHAKMLEVQKVCQHKVMQTQNQVDQLEALNTKVSIQTFFISKCEIVYNRIKLIA